MQELITQLTSKAGLNEDQAKKAIQVISDFIGDKYPMLKGQISNFLGAHGTENKAPQVGGINIPGLG